MHKGTKKVLSDSLLLLVVDFPIRLVDSVYHLPDKQVKFLGKCLRKYKMRMNFFCRGLEGGGGSGC